MNDNTPYTGAFYGGQAAGSLKSAEVIVPLIMSLISPTSVVDVGCGVGTWLSVFSKQPGVCRTLGIEGEWVSTQQLLIPEQNLLLTDLAKPFRIDSTFDLAISLEVAEHLPPESAVQFVTHLTDLSPVVLFSAATPHQGGTNHINEQWPQYWVELFSSHNYECYDVIRPHIWACEDVQWWYAQNTLLFVKRGKALPHLSNFPTTAKPLALIHPNNFMNKHLWLSDASNHGFLTLLRSIPRAFTKSLARRRKTR